MPGSKLQSHTQFVFHSGKLVILFSNELSFLRLYELLLSGTHYGEKKTFFSGWNHPCGSGLVQREWRSCCSPRKIRYTRRPTVSLRLRFFFPTFRCQILKEESAIVINMCTVCGCLKLLFFVQLCRYI